MSIGDLYREMRSKIRSFRLYSQNHLEYYSDIIFLIE